MNLIKNDKQQIYSGRHFGQRLLFHSIQDTKTGKSIAIKSTDKKYKTLFKIEVEVLKSVTNQPGFPKLIWQGKSGQHYYIAMQLLGPTLTSKIAIHRLSLTEICKLGRSVLNSLSILHEACFIHRDIKPENILTGFKSPNEFYLMDFGLSKQYIDKKHQFHYPMKTNTSFKGNLVFCSNYVLNGIEPSRRDDLISLALILVFLVNNNLPWIHETSSVNKMMNKRNSLTMDNIFHNVPNQISRFFQYANGLSFYQKPDYGFLKGLIDEIKDFDNSQITEVAWQASSSPKRNKEKKNNKVKSIKKLEPNSFECSTLKIEPPDFSKSLRKKLKYYNKATKSYYNPVPANPIYSSILKVLNLSTNQ